MGSYFSIFSQHRDKLRTIIKKLESLQNELKDPNIQELLENARVDLANALNIANAVRKKQVHSMTKAKVLRLIVDGVAIRKISIECKVSHDYITKLMRANDIRRYEKRNMKISF